jgi:enoyl-CoA hydratase/carnithine racemase
VTAVEERTRGPLLVTRTARVVTLTLHDPPVNPIARETVAALEELTAAIAADDSVRAVVVTGSGGNFSAGANIKQFGDIGTVETEEGYTRRRVAMVSALERLGKPVVAAVAGNCLGGGFEIALACHFRLADTTARFGLPEITLGVLPAWGGTQRLSRLVPRDVALRMLLLGEPVPAERARELGIVSEVHAPGELAERAAELARRLADQSRLATAAILDAVIGGRDLPLDDGIAIESAGVLACRGSDDAREGARAFLEKRPPRFG